MTRGRRPVRGTRHGSPPDAADRRWLRDPRAPPILPAEAGSALEMAVRRLHLPEEAPIRLTTVGPMRYPDAPRHDVVDDLHGHRVADPYRWLEDAADPATRSWTEAQDALATEA